MKKLSIFIVSLSLLFILGCKESQSDTKGQDGGLSGNIVSGQNTQNESGAVEINSGGVSTGEMKELIDTYKPKESGDSSKLNEDDINLMEKIIDKIEKK